jgi:hypothetical protein
LTGMYFMDFLLVLAQKSESGPNWQAIGHDMALNGQMPTDRVGNAGH